MELIKIKCFLLDLDGTVYLDGKLLPMAKETIEKMRSSGRKICFVTNNSSKSGREYLGRLNAIGLNARSDEICTSGMAAAEYILAKFPGQTVYLCGTPSLTEEFKEYGIRLTEQNPDICVLGFDTTLNYDKICKFNYYLKKGSYYIATHPDLTCPYPEVYIPDTGSFIEMFRASSGRYPDIVCGKPYEPLSRAVAGRFGFKPDEMAMVGDRLKTDVAFAANSGNMGILVLSGETKKSDLAGSGIVPDMVIDGIWQLLPLL